MMAGDGLLVRVRPPLGRLTVPQAIGLAEAARLHGNGLVDLTNRAALQLRGVTEQGHGPLLRRLVALGLADHDPAREARRNFLLAPDSLPRDDTESIALSLIARIAELPQLPSKIGIAIDAGPAPCLAAVPADFRFERSEAGRLLLRVEGRPLGSPTSVETAARDLIALARWFLATGGGASGRAARHEAPLPTAADIAPAPSRPLSQLLAEASGPFHGIPFGQLDADSLIALAGKPHVTALRLTPWRGLILEGGADSAEHASPDGLLRVDACPGAPACPQASVETRGLATRLAPLVEGSLHVSGCAKGCARQRPAGLVLTGRQGRFDLSRNARAGSPPETTGLTARQILALFGRP
ncbi:cobalamin biosynthesis protein CobG [Sphingobium sp. 22B]|uniref:cobalamin biosynthesis protein CobG n=1 Tax=unclassified Sphingobium TaxID=2611147 RepID=UPI000784C026|nr:MULTISPECIES: cobalamin biosynthesis protein CobG [unclassified Sphingobium]KXU33725.1 cobalamin biosynthesis protein CobG [Sphingobium sp. AM]KYC33670.1 cobalamin biosynthesis protein CobG [Sphingobium sp. 22B]OAP33411.1 cobalamin biosynthesis protein CobG [Sphingobium sp. 20006FA]